MPFAMLEMLMLHQTPSSPSTVALRNTARGMAGGVPDDTGQRGRHWAAQSLERAGGGDLQAHQDLGVTHDPR